MIDKTRYNYFPGISCQLSDTNIELQHNVLTQVSSYHTQLYNI
jgi:hypothetical protein